MRNAGDHAAEKPPVISNLGRRRRMETLIICKWRSRTGGLRRRRSESPYVVSYMVGDGTKPQRVHRADRPRAHCEDVANDATHSRRRALEWFDRAGMIVR